MQDNETLASNENIWDLLVQPLEAKVNVLTVKGRKSVSLVAPKESDLKALVEKFPEPQPPTKTIRSGQNKRDKTEVQDPQDEAYLVAVSEYASTQMFIMLDLGLKAKPAGENFEDRLAYYKMLPTPVVGILVGAIQMLMMHQIPPEDFDEMIASAE